MPRKKTKLDDIIEEAVNEAIEEVAAEKELREIQTNFGREDLNELRDTVNELIRKIQ